MEENLENTANTEYTPKGDHEASAYDAESMESKVEAEPEEEGSGAKGKKPKEKRPLWREILDYVIIIIAAYLIALFVTSFIIINCRIPSGSMENTIMTGDRVIGLRLTYTFGKPQRGDIAVFYAPEKALLLNGKEEGTLYIKRVVGLPGDTIEVKNHRIYINGSEEPLDEPYLEESFHTNRLANFGPYTIPEGQYFMMGDHRDNSSDSRAWGTVPEDSIVAKALFTYWPLNHITWLG